MDQPNGPPRVDLLAGLKRSRELWQQQQNQQAARAPPRQQPSSTSTYQESSAPAPRTRLPAATPNGLRLNASAPLVPTSDTPITYASSSAAASTGRGGKRSSTPRARAAPKARRASTGRKPRKKRSYKKRGGNADHDVTSSDDDDDMPPSTPALDQALIADHEFSWRAVKGRRILTVSKSASSPSNQITHPLVLKASGGATGRSSSSVKVVGKSAHSFWKKVKQARLVYPQGQVAASNAIRASYSLVPTGAGAASSSAITTAASLRTQPAPIPENTSAPSAAAMRLMSAMKPSQQQYTHQPVQASNPLSMYFPQSIASSSATAQSRPQPNRTYNGGGIVPITATCIKQEAINHNRPIKQEMLSDHGGCRSGIKQEGGVVVKEEELHMSGGGGGREDSTGSTVSSTTMRQIRELERQSMMRRFQQATPSSRRGGEVEVVELLDSNSDASTSTSIDESLTSSSRSYSHSLDTTVTSSSSSEESSMDELPARQKDPPKNVSMPPSLFHVAAPPRLRPDATTTTTTARRDDSFLTLGGGDRRVPAQTDPRLGNVMRAEAVVPTFTSDHQRFHDEQDGGLLEATGFADEYGEGF